MSALEAHPRSHNLIDATFKANWTHSSMPLPLSLRKENPPRRHHLHLHSYENLKNGWHVDMIFFFEKTTNTINNSLV
jgi:hypothetical protein